ncbi:hypothetical protein [Zunongwangia sp.]
MMKSKKKRKPEENLRITVLIILAIVVFQIIMDWSNFKTGILSALMH